MSSRRRTPHALIAESSRDAALNGVVRPGVPETVAARRAPSPASHPEAEPAPGPGPAFERVPGPGPGPEPGCSTALSSRQAAPRGLTLVELLISMVIVVLLFSAAVVGVGSLTGTRAKAAAAQLAGVMRSLYDTAALSGKTCRLVFLLPAERSEDKSISWTAECAAGDVTARADRDQALKDANLELEKKDKDRNRRSPARFSREDERPSLDELMSREKSRVEAQARFSAFKPYGVVDNEEAKEMGLHLLSGIEISVWTQHQREPTKHGLAYVYFFPQGFAERAQVYFRQGGNVWTIAVSPLTGKVRVVGEELEVPRS